MALVTWTIASAVSDGEGGLTLTVTMDDGTALTVQVPPGSDEVCVRYLCHQACMEHCKGEALNTTATTFAATLVGISQTEEM